jgi:Membrane protein involved in the export of O-antigen and teichoic acid
MNIKKNYHFFQNIREKGFFYLLSSNILIQVVAFASQLFVAGILTPNDLGRIKIIQTYLSIFSIVAGMGFNTSVLKLCSENRTLSDKKSLFQSGLFFTIISTICFYIIIILLNFLHIFSTDKLIQWLIPLGLFPLISNSVFMVFISYFQAIKEIKLISNLTISNKLISIIGIVLLSYWAGIKGYYVAYNLSFIVMLFVSFRLVGSTFKTEVFSTKNLVQFSIHWKYAKTSLFANLLSEMSAYVDIILLNYFVKDMQQIGYYSFALTITVILRLFPGTVQQIASPYFSSLSNEKSDFIKAFQKYNKLLYVTVTGSLVLALFLIPPLTRWTFNGKYDQSMLYFPMLAIGWSLRQLSQLQSGAIFGLGKIQYNAYVSLISLLFNIVTISVSLYFFGLIGAAYASIINGFIFTLCSRYFYKRAQSEM